MQPGGPPAPPRSGIGKGPIVAVVVAILVVIAAIVFFMTRDSGNSDNASATRTDQSDQTDQTDVSDSTDESTTDESASSEVKAPPGFKVISDTTEGVSIAVPSGFTEIDPSEFVNNSNQSDLSNLNPDLAPFLSSGNAFLGGSVLAASGPNNGVPTFVVVAKSPQSFDPTASDFSSELKSQLAAAGAANVTTDTVRLPAGKGLRVGVSLSINTGSATGEVNETLFFVKIGRTTWGIVGASVGNGSSEALFDQIAQTFRVTS